MLCRPSGFQQFSRPRFLSTKKMSLRDSILEILFLQCSPFDLSISSRYHGGCHVSLPEELLSLETASWNSIFSPSGQATASCRSSDKLKRAFYSLDSISINISSSLSHERSGQPFQVSELLSKLCRRFLFRIFRRLLVVIGTCIVLNWRFWRWWISFSIRLSGLLFENYFSTFEIEGMRIEILPLDGMVKMITFRDPGTVGLAHRLRCAWSAFTEHRPALTSKVYPDLTRRY